jgi:predicted MFS family arabinose efflux permease
MRAAPQKARLSIRLPSGLEAFSIPNYRLWALGSFSSAIGGWMQSTAQGFLIFELTKDPAYLGYASVSYGIPIWIFTLYSGVIADRVPRRTLLVVTNTVMMLLAAAMAVLVMSGLVRPWHILVLAFMLGLANAFDAPSRQGFVVDLVGKDHLTNAIGLNASIFHMATMIGPALGGLAYAALGPGWCFAANATSFVVMIYVLLRMRLPAHTPRVRTSSAAGELMEGLRYAVSSRTVRALLLNLVALAMFGFALLSIFPAWAVNVLGGDVRLNGLMLSVRGIGSLAGALLVAFTSSRGARGRILWAATLVLPLSILVFSQMRWIPLALAAVAAMGAGLLMWVNSSNAMLQTETPDDLRGRVMGLFVLIMFGGNPLGSLFLASLASRAGEPAAALVAGCVMLAVSVLTWTRASFLRRLA